LVCVKGNAGPLITNDTPIAFFTNLASRLLQSELNLRLGHIQIYPTNQYTPAVHRLLQVSANIHDAACDRSLGFKNPPGLPPPAFPTVFQPLFQSFNAGNQVYIIGFREVTNLDILNATTRDLSNPNERAN